MISFQIGFTGTQRGLTDYQRDSLTHTLTSLFVEGTMFHHGDCIGADTEAHDIARDLGYSIVIHPPDIDTKRGSVSRDKKDYQHAVWMTPKPYMKRNQSIVDFSNVLIACPGERKEKLRSGTWATIRRAWKAHRSVIMLYPSE